MAGDFAVPCVLGLASLSHSSRSLRGTLTLFHGPRDASTGVEASSREPFQGTSPPKRRIARVNGDRLFVREAAAAKLRILRVDGGHRVGVGTSIEIRPGDKPRGSPIHATATWPMATSSSSIAPPIRKKKWPRVRFAAIRVRMIGLVRIPLAGSALSVLG